MQFLSLLGSLLDFLELCASVFPNIPGGDIAADVFAQPGFGIICAIRLRFPLPPVAAGKIKKALGPGITRRRPGVPCPISASALAGTGKPTYLALPFGKGLSRDQSQLSLVENLRQCRRHSARLRHALLPCILRFPEVRVLGNNECRPAELRIANQYRA